MNHINMLYIYIYTHIHTCIYTHNARMHTYTHTTQRNSKSAGRSIATTLDSTYWMVSNVHTHIHIYRERERNSKRAGRSIATRVIVGTGWSNIHTHTKHNTHTHRNNKRAGWNIATRVIVRTGWSPTSRTRQVTFASPYVPFTPRTRAVRGAAGTVPVRAFDVYKRSAQPALCVSPQSVAGCRFTYRLATDSESGRTYTASTADMGLLPSEVCVCIYMYMYGL